MKRIRAAVGAVAATLGHTVRIYRSIGRYVPGWCGALLVSGGVGMIYIPAGVITAGVLLIAVDRQIPGRGHADGDA